MELTAHSFSCLMAQLPEPIAGKIQAYALALPDADIFEPDDEEYGRVRAGEAHVTVKHGIHSPDSDELFSLLGGCDMIRLVLRGISTFDNEDYHVLKVDVESEDLVRLNRLVSTGVKCTDTHPEYHPHVTIAYLRRREDDPEYPQRFCCGIFDGTEVWVDTLRFSNPAGDKSWILLGGGFGKKLAREAKIARIVRRVMERKDERKSH